MYYDTKESDKELVEENSESITISSTSENIYKNFEVTNETPRKTTIKDRILKAIRQPIFTSSETTSVQSPVKNQLLAHQQTRFRRLAINVKDYRAKGINLKDNLAINATVKVIEKTLKTKYNERCDKKIIATTVTTNFNERDIPDELVFDLPVQNDNEQQKSERQITTKEVLFNKVKSHFSGTNNIAPKTFNTAFKGDEESEEFRIDQSQNSTTKKKVGRKKKLTDRQTVLRIDISSFVNKDKTLKNKQYITNLITFVTSIATKHNLIFTESDISNEVKIQLKMLRSNHYKKLKKRKRDSELWSTQIIDIKIECSLDPQIITDLSTDIHIFNVANIELYPISNTENTNNNSILSSTQSYPSVIDRDLNTTDVKPIINISLSPNNETISNNNNDQSNTTNSFEVLFAKKSEVVILDEENIRVKFDFDIVHHLLNKNNVRNIKRVADCIRVVKRQLIQWKIPEQRIQWSTIFRSFDKRLSTIHFSDTTRDSQQISFSFKLDGIQQN
ncbi:unnamed protein product [Didymodactylos carnosus]|uniref:Uncharacterized protein n=2 Tax=Didymodactylos carnosus TaxID=1234261 RepID=A0A8S2DC63_9BILA|nr:unnamed protein product [Didymodactylos carnosus]CAF3641219.1 unnamed protein product [Didymodactylos carnosus]